MSGISDLEQKFRILAVQTDLPDHLLTRGVNWIRQLDETPDLLPLYCVMGLLTLARQADIHADALEDVHTELAWLDDNLREEYPAWYLPDEDES